jgi:hypothetical protein
MRVVAGLGLFFVLGGLAALAQAAPHQAVPESTGSGTLGPDAANWTCTFDNHGTGGTGTVCKSPVVPACPLDMHVRQRAGGSLVSTDDHGRRVKTFAARLKLEIKDLRPERSGQHMVTAKVSVHGWTPKERILPLDSRIDRNGDLVKTMTVPLAGGGLPDASADLWLPGFTAARMVRLESITFDDGDVWSFGSCEAAPDLYMPVNSSD